MSGSLHYTLQISGAAHSIWWLVVCLLNQKPYLNVVLTSAFTCWWADLPAGGFIVTFAPKWNVGPKLRDALDEVKRRVARELLYEDCI